MQIPVPEQVYKELAEMKTTGQTDTGIQGEMIEDQKRRRLEEYARIWSSRRKDAYVTLSEISD